MSREIQWVSGDVKTIEVDTELSDVSAYDTTKLVFYDPTGTRINDRVATPITAASGTKALRYILLDTDITGADKLFVAIGRWKVVPHLEISAGNGKVRSATPLLVNAKTEGDD